MDLGVTWSMIASVSSCMCLCHSIGIYWILTRVPGRFISTASFVVSNKLCTIVTISKFATHKIQCSYLQCFWKKPNFSVCYRMDKYIFCYRSDQTYSANTLFINESVWLCNHTREKRTYMDNKDDMGYWTIEYRRGQCLCWVNVMKIAWHEIWIYKKNKEQRNIFSLLYLSKHMQVSFFIDILFPLYAFSRYISYSLCLPFFIFSYSFSLLLYFFTRCRFSHWIKFGSGTLNCHRN